jgi:hypothetical protein
MMDEIINTWDSKTSLFYISEHAVGKKSGLIIYKIQDYIISILYE